MAKNMESSIQGLNRIPADPLSDELSPMSDELNHDLEAQLALWTNFQFPSTSAIPPSGIEEGRVFAPERDTASRSRHKAIEDFSSSSFFGNVGASLSNPGPSHAAYERAKLQQLQQHLNPHYHAAAAAAARAEKAYHEDSSGMNDLFSSFLPYNSDGMNMEPLVDPFLAPSDYVNPPVNGGGGLSPLTVRQTRDGSGRPHHQGQGQGQAQMQTIDPSTTSLVNRPKVPLPTKRQKTKAPPIIIPVDQEYAHTHMAPASAIGDDDMDDAEHYVAPIDSNGQPISAAEDKRRRNTLASARFRQKKKEREVAMDRKARELDDRVANLERECESLRKENRMLRGLLVDGVPAAAANVISAGENIELPGEKNGPNGGNGVGASMVAPGASVVLLEELVRLLKANSAVLTGPNSQPTQATGKASTSGKRKRANAD